MRPGPSAVLAGALAVAAWTLGPGSGAFLAEQSGARSGSASVVANASAYDSPAVTNISASVSLGYTSQTGVSLVNHGNSAVTYTWATVSDPNHVVTSVTQCAAPTAVGATCAIKFTGPGLALGSYSFTGSLRASRPSYRSTLMNAVVVVTYTLP